MYVKCLEKYLAYNKHSVNVSSSLFIYLFHVIRPKDSWGLCKLSIAIARLFQTKTKHLVILWIRNLRALEWVLWFRVCHKAIVKVLARLAVIWKLSWGRIMWSLAGLNSSWIVGLRSQFLTTHGQSPSSVPFHWPLYRAAHTMATGFHWMKKQEKVSKRSHAICIT